MHAGDNQDVIGAGVLEDFAGFIVQAGIVSDQQAGQNRSGLPSGLFRYGCKPGLHASIYKSGDVGPGIGAASRNSFQQSLRFCSAQKINAAARKLPDSVRRSRVFIIAGRLPCRPSTDPVSTRKLHRLHSGVGSIGYCDSENGFSAAGTPLSFSLKRLQGDGRCVVLSAPSAFFKHTALKANRILKREQLAREQMPQVGIGIGVPMRKGKHQPAQCNSCKTKSKRQRNPIPAQCQKGGRGQQRSAGSQAAEGIGVTGCGQGDAHRECKCDCGCRSG